MVESRCGLVCSSCTYREPCSCGGCAETNGYPFHGECRIAKCCQDRGLAHCGECDIIPCEALYSFSYLDPEHGDTPQGARVSNCRRLAAEAGKQKWDRVLLTSAGFETPDGRPNDNIKRKFRELLGKPPETARVLFIPTAALSDEAQHYAAMCRKELLDVGIREQNVTDHDVDGTLAEADAMRFDVVYVTGGSTSHLLDRIRSTGFDSIIKKMVYANKVYVGVSAGSLITTPNISMADALNPDTKTAGLSLLHAYLDVHCDDGAAPRSDLPLPHIPLTDRQALWVTWAGFEPVEG